MKIRKTIKATVGTYLEDELGGLYGYVGVDDLFDETGKTLVESYQRGGNNPHIQRMNENYEPLAVKPLLLSLRKDGTLRILDGQQEAILARKRGDTKMMARIVRNLTFRQEANLFYYCNNNVPLSPPVKFRSALLAQHDDHVKINGVVNSSGFGIALRSGKPGRDAKPIIKAVGVLKELFDLGGKKLLGDTLEVIRESFRLPMSGEVDTAAYQQGQFIKAMGYFLHDNPKLKVPKVIYELKDGCNAANLYAQAAKKAKGNRRGRNSIFENLYNSFSRYCRAA